jgi:hypothetical protein
MLALALFAYATDHDGNYPDGKSSTEVFQKLIAGSYITDPSIFYVASPGKLRASKNQKILKPENVCFDVTSPVTQNSSDQLPLVFLTGFKVTYAPGGAAVPVIKPHPDYGSHSWFSGDHTFNGIAVAYKGNNARFAVWQRDFTIPNFVPLDFKPDGKTYRQLTPDGPLP